MQGLEDYGSKFADFTDSIYATEMKRVIYLGQCIAYPLCLYGNPKIVHCGILFPVLPCDSLSEAEHK